MRTLLHLLPVGVDDALFAKASLARRRRRPSCAGIRRRRLKCVHASVPALCFGCMLRSIGPGRPVPDAPFESGETRSDVGVRLMRRHTRSPNGSDTPRDCMAWIATPIPISAPTNRFRVLMASAPMPASKKRMSTCCHLSSKRKHNVTCKTWKVRIDAMNPTSKISRRSTQVAIATSRIVCTNTSLRTEDICRLRPFFLIVDRLPQQVC